MDIGLGQLGAEIDRLKREVVVTDWGPTLQKANSYLTGRIEQSFAGRVSPDGTPWPGDADLVDKGALKEDLVGAGRGVVTGNSLVRGSSKPTASIHQYGVPKTGKKRFKRVRVEGADGRKRTRNQRVQLATKSYRVPPRPMIGLVDVDADRIAQIAVSDLFKGK